MDLKLCLSGCSPDLTTTLGAAQLASATGHCVVQSGYLRFTWDHRALGSRGNASSQLLCPVSLTHGIAPQTVNGWITELPFTRLSHSKIHVLHTKFSIFRLLFSPPPPPPLLAVLTMEPSVLHMLGKRSATELPPSLVPFPDHYGGFMASEAQLLGVIPQGLPPSGLPTSLNFVSHLSVLENSPPTSSAPLSSAERTQWNVALGSKRGSGFICLHYQTECVPGL